MIIQQIISERYFQIKFQNRKQIKMSISSQKNLQFIPRSVKSSSNLRRGINSLSKKPAQFIPKFQDNSQRAKFKPIHDWNSSKQIAQTQQNINVLDSKYNVYKHGSPNYYSYNLQGLKANTLKNQIQTLDLPFIDNVIKQLKNKHSKQNNANMRDFQLYPSLLKTHQTHKFKQLLSDKQELKDFLKWFQNSCKIIDQKDISLIKKFQQKQIVISGGFSQITQQVSKLSKARSQLLRMLWNKQNNQVQQIIQNLTSKSLQMQKQHLMSLSKIHQQYQQQIDVLKRQNNQLSKKLNQESFINKGYVNTLRCNRKTIKKYQIFVKNIIDVNQNLVEDNLNLLDENTKLIMSNKLIVNQNFQQNTKSRTKNKIRTQFFPKGLQPNNNNFQQPSQLKYSQARVLLYRRLQIQQKKQQSRQIIRNVKKQISDKIKKQSQNEVIKRPFYSSLQELQQKKKSLYQYLLQRFQQNPNQKLYIREDFFHEDDHVLQTQSVQKLVKKLIDSKQVTLYLRNEKDQQSTYQLKQVGVNTIAVNAVKSNEQRQKQRRASRINQQEIISKSEQAQNTRRISKGLFGMNINKGWSQDYQKGIRQSKLKTRNSLLNLELQKFKSLVYQSRQVESVKQQEQLQIEVQEFLSKQALLINNNKRQPHVLNHNDSIFTTSQLQQKVKQYILNQAIHNKFPRKPQKYLSPILNSLWKNIINKLSLHKGQLGNTTFLKQLFSVIQKQNHQNDKTCQASFFYTVSMIKHFQSIDQLCLVCSLLMNVSQKYGQYPQFIKQDVTKIYFELFNAMNIVQEGQFINIHKPITNLAKLRSKPAQIIMQKYFSQVKLIQINTKLKELILYRKQNKNMQIVMKQRHKIDPLRDSVEISQTQKPTDQFQEHIPLNELILYILQIYLIEKQKYASSYKHFINFFVDQHDSKHGISTQNWRILCILFEINQFNNFPGRNCSQKHNSYFEDDFYRLAILNDLPLLQQKLIQIQCLFSYLPLDRTKPFQLNLLIEAQGKANPFEKMKQWQQVSQTISLRYRQLNGTLLIQNKHSDIQSKGINNLLSKMKKVLIDNKSQQKLQTFLRVFKMLVWRLVK